ncbi:MAG: phytanoyl-CoA dioxygenase family protein, partial [Polaromonas sp.]
MNPASEALQRRIKERVTDQMVQDFQRDGAVCIRQLLNADEIALLRDGIEANLAAPSARAKVASRPDDPGRFFEDFCNWQTLPQLGQFIQDTPLALAAQRLMRSNTVRLYHDHVLVKEPGTRQRTPWHQDQPYYNIEGQQNISM